MLLVYLKESFRIEYWAKSQLQPNNFPNSIYYTYWFTFITTGLAFSNLNKIPKVKLTSRAHGIDLYERQGYLPLQKLTIKKLDKTDFTIGSWV